MAGRWILDGTEIGEVDLDEAIDRYRVPLLAGAEFHAGSMPQGRRAWFDEFVTRCLEQALLKTDRRSLHSRQDFDHLWIGFSQDLAREGVVKTIVDLMGLVHDPDGKEEARGWASSARCTVEVFLQDLDIRDVLESAVTAKDPAYWTRYPGWFGHEIHVDHYRAKAVRFLPAYTPDIGWCHALLNDEVPEVRHFAAMHLARDGADRVDDLVLQRLTEAAHDGTWTWSWADQFNWGRDGRHEALIVMERLSPRPLR